MHVPSPVSGKEAGKNLDWSSKCRMNADDRFLGAFYAWKWRRSSSEFDSRGGKGRPKRSEVPERSELSSRSLMVSRVESHVCNFRSEVLFNPEVLLVCS